MSQYEEEFGRPIPEGFKEVEVCLGCGADSSRDCGCPCGTGFCLVHVDDSSLTTEERKKVYVSKHTCHWPGCPKEVSPAMWGCREHWFTLPPVIRARIQRAYRPGQEIDKRPSANYIHEAQRAQEWIRKHETSIANPH